MVNVLKLASGVPLSKLNCPPNNCIPRRAVISMNKNSRNNKEMIDLIELSSDITKLRNEDQYLVTLNILSSRKALSTEKPKEPPFMLDHTTSKMEPVMTTQSNRLKADSK